MTFVNHFFFIGLHAATWLIGLLCLIMSTFDLVERVDAYRTVAHFLFDLKMFRTIVVREMVAFVTGECRSCLLTHAKPNTLQLLQVLIRKLLHLFLSEQLG